MTRILLWIGWAFIVLVPAAALAKHLYRRRLPGMACPTLPCDACDRPVAAGWAHTHHHEPGCGIDEPAVERCRCDYWLCPSCCPCDLDALLGVDGG